MGRYTSLFNFICNMENVFVSCQFHVVSVEIFDSLISLST